MVELGPTHPKDETSKKEFGVINRASFQTGICLTSGDESKTPPQAFLNTSTKKISLSKEHVDIPRDQRKCNNRAPYTEGGVLRIFKPNISFLFLWDKTISHRN